MLLISLSIKAIFTSNQTKFHYSNCPTSQNISIRVNLVCLSFQQITLTFSEFKIYYTRIFTHFCVSLVFPNETTLTNASHLKSNDEMVRLSSSLTHKLTTFLIPPPSRHTPSTTTSTLRCPFTFIARSHHRTSQPLDLTFEPLHNPFTTNSNLHSPFTTAHPKPAHGKGLTINVYKISTQYNFSLLENLNIQQIFLEIEICSINMQQIFLEICNRHLVHDKH